MHGLCELHAELVQNSCKPRAKSTQHLMALVPVQPSMSCCALLPGRCSGCKATSTGRQHAAFRARSHSVVARQALGAQSFTAQMVLVPQRDGCGLCGTVPRLLFVDAWSDAYGRKSDFLNASSADILTSASRISLYLIPKGVFANSSTQAAPLPACLGPLRGSCSESNVPAFQCAAFYSDGKCVLDASLEASAWTKWVCLA